MAGQIRVTPEELRGVSQQLASMCRDLAWQQDDLKRDSARLSQVWKGQASDAYQCKFKELIPVVETLVIAMERYSDVIRDTADEYERTEAEIAAMFH